MIPIVVTPKVYATSYRPYLVMMIFGFPSFITITGKPTPSTPSSQKIEKRANFAVSYNMPSSLSVCL